LFGLIDFAKLGDARIGNRRHRALRRMGQRRVGSDACQPVKERALSRSLVADNSDFHEGQVSGEYMSGEWSLAALNHHSPTHHSHSAMVGDDISQLGQGLFYRL